MATTNKYAKLIAVFPDGREIILRTSRFARDLVNALCTARELNLYPGRNPSYYIVEVIEPCTARHK